MLSLLIMSFPWILTISFRLKQKHDGRYLAKVVWECLKQFGLDKQVTCSLNFMKIEHNLLNILF